MVKYIEAKEHNINLKHAKLTNSAKAQAKNRQGFSGF